MIQTQFTEQQRIQFLNEEIREWYRREVLPEMRRAIEKRRRHIPDELPEDLEAQFGQGLSDAMTTFALSFADAGRIVDMKSVNFRKRPITREENFILAWARKRGRGKFRRGVPGYSRESKMGIDTDKQLQRIASAIIAAKPRAPKYRRRGQWYSKTMWSLLGRLVNRIARNQAGWLKGLTREELEDALRDTRLNF